MIGLIITVIVLGLLYWIVSLLPLPDPFPIVIKVLFILILIVVLLNAFGFVDVGSWNHRLRL